ncbi:hypothetical protein COU74_00540 [Candidatus Peregrinibacteria bacterium CG10_big_fil_rev_8_21_14_0_10_36_19]|nr:MAG: hypothetical protein COU74_00540 [Candidatus Peregrinibacteria bacterium CG10_big_fil_rev_8_21_14_0_10_36_19]
MMKQINTFGFSILEVILVVFILSMVAGFGFVYFQTSQVRADVNTQAADIVAYLRLSQSNAISGSSEHNAVHLQSNGFVLFTGSSFNPIDATNFSVELPSTLSIANISLNGSGDNVIFNSPDGTTSTYGSFDLTSAQINKTITININEIGTIDY